MKSLILALLCIVSFLLGLRLSGTVSKIAPSLVGTHHTEHVVTNEGLHKNDYPTHNSVTAPASLPQEMPNLPENDNNAPSQALTSPSSHSFTNNDINNPNINNKTINPNVPVSPSPTPSQALPNPNVPSPASIEGNQPVPTDGNSLAGNVNINPGPSNTNTTTSAVTPAPNNTVHTAPEVIKEEAKIVTPLSPVRSNPTNSPRALVSKKPRP